MWHNLTPIEQRVYFGRLQLCWTALCCPTDIYKVWLHISPSCRPGQHPLPADIWGKPLCCRIINIPLCLQRCRAAAVLPTVLWQEIFHPPAAVPTFPECLGSVKADFLTLHLACAQGRGTNRLIPRVDAHSSQSQCDQHPTRVPQCPEHTDRAVTWAKHWAAPPVTAWHRDQGRCQLKSPLTGFEHQTPTNQRDPGPAQWKADQKTWIHVSTPLVFPQEQVAPNSADF